MLRGSAEYLFDHQRARDAAPACGPCGSLGGDVVVHQHRREPYPRHLRCHGKVHHVAVVVFRHKQDALARIDGLDRRDDLVGSRRREDLPRARRVEHP